MTRERLTVPEQNVREYAHELAYRIACEQLAGIADIEKQCRQSGAQYTASKKLININHLNQSYQISFPDGDVSLTTGEEVPVTMRDKILILHYFLQAKGTPLSNKLITYKELPDGINYFPVFSKRAIQPLITFFGSEPEQLIKTAEILGGHKANYGDVAVTISAFEYVPVTIVLWRGDKEFPPEGSLMFDSTISDYLTNDDIHTLCENIAWRMVRLLKTGGDNPG
jgi:hypothetical protein